MSKSATSFIPFGEFKTIAFSDIESKPVFHNMSRLMGKPTICIGENKGADQLRGHREADQRLCFRYSDSTIPPLLKYTKFQASSTFLCFYSSVCVGPGRKPHCWFSHEAAQMQLVTGLGAGLVTGSVCSLYRGRFFPRRLIGIFCRAP